VICAKIPDLWSAVELSSWRRLETPIVSRSALAVRARGLSLPREAASPTPTQPVLKWPGGKRKIAGLIVRFFPAKFERYFEPFFGGGALFFMLQPKSAVLSDVNQKLMDAYIAMRDETEAVIGALSRMPNGEEAYYRIRAASPSTKHVAAARMIYLCTYSFNGIYRENRKGEYNVPYGQKIGHRKPTPATLRRAAMALRGCTLSAGDFGATTVGAKKDDLVYFDPPYTLKHSNNVMRHCSLGRTKNGSLKPRAISRPVACMSR
jgi:DNA adenine methylase